MGHSLDPQEEWLLGLAGDNATSHFYVPSWLLASRQAQNAGEGVTRPCSHTATKYPATSPCRASPESVGKETTQQVLLWLSPCQSGCMWPKGAPEGQGAFTWPPPSLTPNMAKMMAENMRK